MKIEHVFSAKLNAFLTTNRNGFSYLNYHLSTRKRKLVQGLFSAFLLCNTGSPSILTERRRTPLPADLRRETFVSKGHSASPPPRPSQQERPHHPSAAPLAPKPGPAGCKPRCVPQHRRLGRPTNFKHRLGKTRRPLPSPRRPGLAWPGPARPSPAPLPPGPGRRPRPRTCRGNTTA